jgi:hypothetical protein
MSRPIRISGLVAAMAMLVLVVSPTAIALGPVEDVRNSNTEHCSDGIGLSYSDAEFDQALALGGQDEDEFKSSRYACGSYSSDGRYEVAQCSEPTAFQSFPAAGIAANGWVVCIVTMLVDNDGRGFKASLDDYEAVLADDRVVTPDPVVSSWAGDDEGLFALDLSAGKIFPAGGMGKGLLAFPAMPNDDFVLRNKETGNQFLVSTRETSLRNLLPIVAAPETGPIVMSGNGYSSSPWILSLGHPLRVTLDVKNAGSIVSLDAQYRIGAGSFFARETISN